MSDERGTRMAIEAFGVCFAVEVDDAALIEAVESRLPPGWERCAQEAECARYALSSRDGFHYEVTRDDQSLGQAAELEIALAVLESAIRSDVSERAVDLVFVRAGAVSLEGRGLVLPGPSFSGKTTLVRELVRQGATYVSDEYALFDWQGRLRSYGGTLFSPVHLKLVAATAYDPDATWSPRQLGPAEGTLMLLPHVVQLRDTPARTIEIVRAAMAHAVAIESARGEARDAAIALLELLAVS